MNRREHRMFRTTWITLLTVSALACGGANRRVASPEARAIKFTEWSKRDATAPLWPASAKRVQIVVTGGYAEGDHMVWVVSEGTTVLVVYRVAARRFLQRWPGHHSRSTPTATDRPDRVPRADHQRSDRLHVAHRRAVST